MFFVMLRYSKNFQKAQMGIWKDNIQILDTEYLDT